MYLLRSLSVVAALWAACPAQVPLPSGEGSHQGDEEIARRKRAAAEGVDTGDVEDKEQAKADGKAAMEEWEKLTPEERLNRSIRHGASNYCTFVATPKPSKLLPGQSGVVVVTAVLKGNAVLPAPAQLQVTSPAAQGQITLGTPGFREAEPGKIEKGYLGRPVYENWMIFEVPVTMGPEARLGTRQPVALEMKFDLFDGTSAQAVGRFIDRVSTEIEVGATADPNVVGRVQPVAAVPPAAPAGDDAAAVHAGGRGGATTAPERRIEAAATEAVDSGASGTLPTGEGPAPAPFTDEEGSLPLPLLIGGGALLLAILLLVLGRKR